MAGPFLREVLGRTILSGLDFALDCGYIAQEEYSMLDTQYDEVNAMLYSLINKWQNFSNT